MKEDFSLVVTTDEEKNQARRTKKFYFRYRVVMGIMVIVMLVLSLLAYDNRYFRSYEKEKIVSEEYSDGTGLLTYRKGILRYSSSKIAYIKNNGEVVWEKTCSAKQPIVKVNGDYAALADKNDTKIHVYDKNGTDHEQTVSYGITDLEITENGDIAVILKATDTSYIQMLNLKGEKILGIQASIDDTGYPLDLALAPDGKMMCVSYYSVKGVDTKNSVSFYDLSGGAEETEKLIFGDDMDDTIVPTVSFINENTVVAFGDDQIRIYQTGSKVKETKTIELDTTVKSIATDDNHFAIIRTRTSDEKKGNYTLEVFSKNGNRIASSGISGEYTDFKLSGKNVLLTGAYRSAIYTTRGKKIFDYKFQSKLYEVAPAGNGRNYFMAFEDQVDLMKLK